MNFDSFKNQNNIQKVFVKLTDLYIYMGNGKSSEGDGVPPELPSPDDSEKKKKKGMFQMMGDGYEQLINAIVRPPRAEYDLRDLGPTHFQISGCKFERVDLILKNERNMKLACSWWKPKKPKADTLPCVVCTFFFF
jgi:hypothetical protein